MLSMFWKYLTVFQLGFNWGSGVKVGFQYCGSGVKMGFTWGWDFKKGIFRFKNENNYIIFIECGYKCESCNQTNVNTCSVCKANSFRDILNNCDCQEGYYEDPLDKLICKKCPYYCKTCTFQTKETCSTCETLHNRTNSSKCLC